MKTEKSYVQWIKRFILFHNKQHPAKMGKPEVEQFLTSLAVVRKAAPSTQNQALQAILAALPSQYQMIGKLFYGSGLRLMECLVYA